MTKLTILTSDQPPPATVTWPPVYPSLSVADRLRAQGLVAAADRGEGRKDIKLVADYLRSIGQPVTYGR